MSIAVFCRPPSATRTCLKPLSAFITLLLIAFPCASLPLMGEKPQGQSQTKQHSEDWQWLDDFVESTRESWQVPGLAVAVVHKDQLVFAKGFGTKKLGIDDPVDENTLFAIASNSKAFTASALAILVDEDKLTWDSHVADYLPWLQLKDKHATLDLRVRDLLCHRSGLGTFSGDLLWWGTNYSPEEVLRRARTLAPAAPFRSRYGYSNLMFLAAGEVVGKASGLQWNEFIEQRIFQPLHMDRSVTSVKDLIEKGNFATPHKTFSDHSEPIRWTNWDTMAAAGGIISSVKDMSNWLRLQLRNGKLESSGKQLFSKTQALTMRQAHMPIPVSEGYRARYPSTHFRSYGLGWALSDYQGRKIAGHGGGYDGMYSQVVMVPEEELGIVVLTNSMTSISPAITYQILDKVLADTSDDQRSEKLLESFRKGRVAFEDRIERAVTPVVSDTQPSHPLEDFTGHFQCPLYGNAEIASEVGVLVLKGLPNPKLVADLEHLHYDTFKLKWRNKYAWFGTGTIHFVANSRGEFHKLEFNVPNDDLWFYELQFTRVK